MFTHSVGLFNLNTLVFNSRFVFCYFLNYFLSLFSSGSGNSINILYFMHHISNFSLIFFLEMSATLFSCLLSQAAMHIDSFSCIPSLFHLPHSFTYISSFMKYL